MADKQSPLKKIRMSRGITQEQLAERAGTSQSTISAIEDLDGEQYRPCTAEMAAAIVKVIGPAYITELQILYPHRYT
jgi:transcriptional regulator with XRE-family HTH domain